VLWFLVFSFYTDIIIEVVADDDHHFMLSYIYRRKAKVQTSAKYIKKLSPWKKLQSDHESAIWVLQISSRICKHLQIFMISEYLMIWV
jgi:hypothetical protein